MRLIHDADGCFFNFTESLKLYLVEHCGRIEHELPEAKVWNFFIDQWGMTLDEFVEICHAGVDAGVIFRQGPAFPGSVDALARLKAKGHTIHIITDRRFGSKSPQNTVEWLQEVGIEYDSLTFSADKTIVEGDLLLEDRDTNYIAVERAGNATPVLMSRPWNLDLVGARRVNDWAEFERFVDRWEDRHA